MLNLIGDNVTSDLIREFKIKPKVSTNGSEPGVKTEFLMELLIEKDTRKGTLTLSNEHASGAKFKKDMVIIISSSAMSSDNVTNLLQVQNKYKIVGIKEEKNKHTYSIKLDEQSKEKIDNHVEVRHTGPYPVLQGHNQTIGEILYHTEIDSHSLDTRKTAATALNKLIYEHEIYSRTSLNDSFGSAINRALMIEDIEIMEEGYNVWEWTRNAYKWYGINNARFKFIKNDNFTLFNDLLQEISALNISDADKMGITIHQIIKEIAVSSKDIMERTVDDIINKFGVEKTTDGFGFGVSQESTSHVQAGPSLIQPRHLPTPPGLDGVTQEPDYQDPEKIVSVLASEAEARAFPRSLFRIALDNPAAAASEVIYAAGQNTEPASQGSDPDYATPNYNRVPPKNFLFENVIDVLKRKKLFIEKKTSLENTDGTLIWYEPPNQNGELYLEKKKYSAQTDKKWAIFTAGQEKGTVTLKSKNKILGQQQGFRITNSNDVIYVMTSLAIVLYLNKNINLRVFNTKMDKIIALVIKENELDTSLFKWNHIDHFLTETGNPFTFDP